MDHSDPMFEKLWGQYAALNPSAARILQLFEDLGDDVLNDHIAFRTFNDPRLGIDVLARPFISRGYREKGAYRFREKHLSARHYELEGNEHAPRIFISELLLEEFSEELRGKVRKMIDGLDKQLLDTEELVLTGSVFGKPSWKTYESLRSESEYAAWLYIFGFRANHFTISVNSLKSFDGIKAVNDFLKDKGFKLNSSGGEIKGSKQQMLMQSSTLAEHTELEFLEGTFSIPACYYEFAERFPGKDGRLFGGFIAGSADKIFESTDFHEKDQ